MFLILKQIIRNYIKIIKLTTYRNNVESAVTDFPDLGVLVMHEINEVGGGLRVLDNDLSC